MSTQVFVASTAFGLATLAAAIDEGLFEPAEHRVLVLTNNSGLPEISIGIPEVAGWEPLSSRFDTVVDYNDAVAPLHPAGWIPRAAELPMWERFFRLRWGLEGDLELVIESIQAAPAHTMARIFADARIHVYADGLMSYGPTRSSLPDDVGWRIERLLHLDLIPGLTPMLLTEWDVPPVVIGWPSFRAVIASLTSERPAPSEPYALVLGQYLAAADLLTPEEEIGLYAEMITRTGFDRVLFKPHPSAPASHYAALRAAAAAAGVELEICPDPELVESWLGRGSVGVVVGCFSTALLTAATAYGLPVVQHGTELMLDRLTPFQNSNRIPVTLVDALVPTLDGTTRPPLDLNDLVNAVGYTMQADRYSDRRGAAAAFLTAHPEARARYVKRRRLTRLHLPGGLPPQVRRRSLRRRLGRILRGNFAA